MFLKLLEIFFSAKRIVSCKDKCKIQTFSELSKEEGQATVEAAIMIPIIFIMLLLLLQPGILLYDRTVMAEAASEGCRVLTTTSEGNKQSNCEPYIRRRLGSIPQQDNFHVHGGSCSYEIEMSGNQDSQIVSVSIKNQVKPLPLVGFLSGMLGILNSEGNFEVKVSSSQRVKPEWSAKSPSGSQAEKWVGKWLE